MISRYAGLPRLASQTEISREAGGKRTEAAQDALEQPEVEEAVPAVSSFGRLPDVAVVSSMGLLLVALADTAARSSTSWAEPLFWLGLLVVFAPIAARLASSALVRWEAIGLIVLLAVELYLVKILQSPLTFTYHDEFMHWRTAYDIITTHHLFTTNYILPISSMYPGMEIATNSLVSLTGLSVYGAGSILIGVARTLFMLGLFLLYERISGSFQTAGVAVALYAANPNFVFFDAAFSYESLAISLTVLVLFSSLRGWSGTQERPVQMILVSLLAIMSVVTTHHLTAYFLAAFLVMWLLIDIVRRRSSREHKGPLSMAIIAVVSCLVWTVFVANASIEYLAPPLRSALVSLMRLITQEATPRRLFEQASGQVTPLWDKIVSFGAVGLILLVLPFGLVQIWKRHRSSSLALTLAICALGYPITLSMRFVGAAWEAANRSSEFLFLALALVLAAGLRPLLSSGRFGSISQILFTIGASLLVMGGLIIGWPPAWLLPGPYEVPVGLAGGSRSVEQEGVAAAEWARSYLGPGNIVGADETNMLLMSTYGQQQVSTTLSGGQDINWVLYAPQMQAEQEKTLRRGSVRFLVVDYRLATVPSLTKNYYPGTDIKIALSKFDSIRGISKIFDSGDIRIYDVKGLLDEP